ncbi:MAG TPA: DUF2950 family protein, partial [Burkholderiales bacterium]|nr:DUF2950 family protein [Burkholderiales bacterium]
MIARTASSSAVVNAAKRNTRAPNRRSILQCVVCALMFSIAPLARASDLAQATFDSPQAGVAALVAAVEANDAAALRVILGTHGEKLMNSGDAVADANYRAAFVKAYRRGNAIETTGDRSATLVIGKDRWPLPIPLAKSNGAWHFDTPKGEQEILDRRIGRNELATIQVCLAIVDAQRDYVAMDQDRNGVLEYAAKFV